MAYEEWDREIPPEEQLQEVARILAKAVLRKHRYPNVIPRATTEKPRGVNVATARSKLHERRWLDQFDDDAWPARENLIQSEGEFLLALVLPPEPRPGCM